jgi:hypothetical protein
MTSPKKLKPLWRCPVCGERFVTRNLWHSCGRFSLKSLFARSEPHVFELFNSFAQLVKRCGPVRIIPQKTRVAFQVRMRFVACYPRKSYLICTLVLPRLLESPRITKIQRFSPNCVLHFLPLRSQGELDRQLQTWLHESYRVGAQADAARK